MRTYTRINEDYLDNITIDTEDISMHDEICSEINQWIYDGAQPPLDLTSLPDAFYPVADKDELSKIIELCMDLYGKECSLNWIDVSRITDMSWLFRKSMFNGNISRWDVSNVENMCSMFVRSKFNGNISGWDVSHVRYMQFMFNMSSLFNRDISEWDVSSVENMRGMFCNANKFNQNLSKWDVSSVIDMTSMLRNSSIDCDLSSWNVSNVKWNENMFVDCPLENRPDRQPKFND